MNCKSCRKLLDIKDFIQKSCINCNKQLDVWEKNQLLRNINNTNFARQCGFKLIRR